MHEDTPYPDPTRRSGHLYLMTKKHHGAGGPTASCWSLTPENEFRVFDEGDSHRIVESRKIYGVLRVGDELQLIGTWQQVVAIFYPPELPGRWHGHPLFPVRSAAPDSLKVSRMKPSKNVLKLLQDAALITLRERKRLAKGDHP